MSTSAGALTRSIAIALRSNLRFNYPTVSMVKAGCLWRKPLVLPMVCGAYRRFLPMAFSTRAGNGESQPEAPAKSPSGSKASSMDDLDDDFDFKRPFLNPYVVKQSNKGYKATVGKGKARLRLKGPDENGLYCLVIPMRKIYEDAGMNCDDYPFPPDSESEEDEDEGSGSEDDEN